MKFRKILALVLAIISALSVIPFSAAYAEDPVYQEIELIPPIQSSMDSFMNENFAPIAQLAAGDVFANHSLTIDEIVAKAKELPHIGFDKNRETQMEVEPKFTAPYEAGSVKQSDLNDALNALKMVRFLTGLPYENIYLDDSITYLGNSIISTAQHKAVLMAVSEYSHFAPPPADMSDEFYKIAQFVVDDRLIGIFGVSECIYRGPRNISDSILGYIADEGVGNIAEAGHRMSLLQPDGQKYGIGFAKNPSIIPEHYRYLSAVHTRYSHIETNSSYIAWPNAGDFPIQYFINTTNLKSSPIYPWSLSLGSDYQPPNKNEITLTLTRTRDNKTWTFNSSTANLADGGYDDTSLDHLAVIGNNIVFRPNSATLGAIMDGDVFNINVSGIKTSGGAPTTLAYSINFFDLEKEMNKSRVNITVKHNSTPVQGAAVVIDGQTLTTDINGLVTLRVVNNKSYNYTVNKSGYSTVTGTVNVGTSAVSTDVPVYLPVDFVISNTTKTYNGVSQGVTVTASPDVAYTVKYNGSATIPKDAGTYTVLVEANAAGYSGSKTAALTIGKANITVKAEDKFKKIGNPDPILTQVITSGQLFSGDNFTGTLTRAAGETIKTYAINKGTLALSSNYNMTFTPGIFTILDKTPQNITVTGMTDKTYGDSPFSLTVTPDSTALLNNYTFNSGDTTVAAINAAGEITIKKSGSTLITVTEPGNAEYAPFKWTRQLVIKKAVLDVTADDKFMIYGDSLPDLTITYFGFVYGENENDLPAKPSVTLKNSGKINAGNHTLIISGGISSNYEFDYKNGILDVAKKDVTISGSTLSVYNKEYQAGDKNATIKNFGCTVSDFILGDDVRIDIDALIGKFDDDAIGSDKNVTISGISLIGSDKDNYNLTSTVFVAKADIVAELTAQDIAGEITGFPLLLRDATHIEMPVVPYGFDVSIKSKNNTAIDLNGNISPVDDDTDVILILTVTKTINGTTADTSEIIVTILSSTKYKVTATGTGGNITGSGIYNKNSNVILTATPDTNYLFDGWYENGTKINGAGVTYSFTITKDRTLEAKFIAPYTINIIAGTGGSVSGGGVYFSGAAVTLIATPDTNYLFDGWYENGTKINNANAAYNFTAASNRDLEAKFNYFNGGGNSSVENGSGSSVRTTPAKPGYSFSGENKYTKGSKIPLVIIIQKNFSLFRDLKNNGITLTRDKQYKVENGSTIITLSTDYLDTLPAKQYTLEIRFTDGLIINANFTIMESEKSKLWINIFTDVHESDWFYEDVKYAHQKSLISGMSATTFNPQFIMTRAMMVTILWNHNGKSQIKNKIFTDVADGMWYTDAVNWAAANGIVLGYGDGLFGPNDEITREQMAVMLYNYAKFIKKEFPKKRTGTFIDDAKISTWAKEAVNFMYYAKILNGKGNNDFDPQGKATRAEVAAMMRNFLED